MFLPKILLQKATKENEWSKKEKIADKVEKLLFLCFCSRRKHQQQVRLLFTQSKALRAIKYFFPLQRNDFWQYLNEIDFLPIQHSIIELNFVLCKILNLRLFSNQLTFVYCKKFSISFCWRKTKGRKTDYDYGVIRERERERERRREIYLEVLCEIFRWERVEKFKKFGKFWRLIREIKHN